MQVILNFGKSPLATCCGGALQLQVSLKYEAQELYYCASLLLKLNRLDTYFKHTRIIPNFYLMLLIVANMFAW